MANEIWRPVVGYEGFYEVSDQGRVKRLARYVNAKNGSFTLQPTRLLNPYLPKAGYPQVGLCRDNKAKTLCVHRLVCEAFHGPPPSPEHQVAHNDGSRDNNAAENLRWATARENAEDRATHGTEPTGEASGKTPLTVADVLAIRAEHEQKYGSLAKLGREYGVTTTAIYNIVNRITWKHI